MKKPEKICGMCIYCTEGESILQDDFCVLENKSILYDDDACCSFESCFEDFDNE